MNETLQNLMREATRLTQSGNLQEATRVIQRALGQPARNEEPTRASVAILDAPIPNILDGCVFEVDEPHVVRPESPSTQAPSPSKRAQDVGPTGEFSQGSHTHASLSRHYKLYTPPGSAGKRLPLVVMLHGCTQNPDDFAAGTGMNELAKAQDVCVLYPAQSQNANPQRCWNWFKHNHQSRGRGEAALLASMTLAVIQQHDIDARRVYVAGLSAGGAMAANLAAAYPEIFAAVGVHSGLAVGVAVNLAEALSAMSGGAAHVKLASKNIAVPTIVFHGDQDRTVHPRNGDQIIEALGTHAESRVQQGVSKQGQSFTRTCHVKNNVEFAELWVLHEAGHAWSGGNPSGSYTDAQGPDASAEMLRFFAQHVKPA